MTIHLPDEIRDFLNFECNTSLHAILLDTEGIDDECAHIPVILSLLQQHECPIETILIRDVSEMTSIASEFTLWKEVAAFLDSQPFPKLKNVTVVASAEFEGKESLAEWTNQMTSTFAGIAKLGILRFSFPSHPYTT